MRRVLPYIAILAVAGLLLLGWLVVEVRDPDADPVPQRVDGIVQLGGVTETAYLQTRALGDTVDHRGASADLAFSVPEIPAAERQRVCDPLPGSQVTCFEPDPTTTRGEARAIAQLAHDRHWHSVHVLATGPEHVERARFVIGRCLEPDVQLTVGYQPVDGGRRRAVGQFLYQSAATLKATIAEDGC